MRKTKKILGVLLASAFVVGAVPVTAHAAEYSNLWSDANATSWYYNDTLNSEQEQWTPNDLKGLSNFVNNAIR